jgi:hypothetical protein
MVKVPCPLCGVLYAWNASKRRVRNHGTCQFDAPVQKKPAFRVVVAQPSSLTNVYRSNVTNASEPSAPVAPAPANEDIEEFYRQNLIRNEELAREGKLKYEALLKEKAAEADRLLQIELEKQRFYEPWNTALGIKPTATSCAIPVYWMDRSGGFYEIHKDTPYTLKPPLQPPTIRRRQKKVLCKVYWNSNFGDTNDLCEGEWEMQWVMRWIRV